MTFIYENCNGKSFSQTNEDWIGKNCSEPKSGVGSEWKFCLSVTLGSNCGRSKTVRTLARCASVIRKMEE